MTSVTVTVRSQSESESTNLIMIIGVPVGGPAYSGQAAGPRQAPVPGHCHWHWQGKT